MAEDGTKNNKTTDKKDKKGKKDKKKGLKTALSGLAGAFNKSKSKKNVDLYVCFISHSYSYITHI